MIVLVGVAVPLKKNKLSPTRVRHFQRSIYADIIICRRIDGPRASGLKKRRGKESIVTFILRQIHVAAAFN